jgi:hypothetical protein
MSEHKTSDRSQVAVPKKVLIVAYYWPPAGGPGVQRWVHFVKHLPAYGIEPIVYVPENASYPIEDYSLLEAVSSEIKVVRQPISEPYKWVSWLFKKQTKRMSQGLLNEKNSSFIERLLRAVRGNFFIPDARVSWVKPSIAFLESYMTVHGIETVITSGPPHSMHLIGLGLKQKGSIKWLADFRDPWTSIGYHKALYLLPFAKKRHQALEAQVLRSADKIITTSPSTAQEFAAITQKPISVITNGYEAAAPILESVATAIKDQMKGFSMLHIGSLLAGRNPSILWVCLSELIKENKVFKATFSLHFVGLVSDVVKEHLYFHGLSENCVFHGYKPHSQARAFQKEGQLLLLLEIDSPQHKGIIPGKLFEYMASESPILAVGPKAWDVNPIISESAAGAVFEYTDKAALKGYILKVFMTFNNGEETPKPQGIEAYHRKALTEKLANIIQLWA